MRLINRDKLLETYKKWIPQLSSKEDEGDRRGVETCIAVLEDTPAVDAVPVVRCRECKYHHDCGTHFCDALGMDCPDDSEFFCSYGKQKGDDD